MWRAVIRWATNLERGFGAGYEIQTKAGRQRSINLKDKPQERQQLQPPSLRIAWVTHMHRWEESLQRLELQGHAENLEQRRRHESKDTNSELETSGTGLFLKNINVCHFERETACICLCVCASLRNNFVWERSISVCVCACAHVCVHLGYLGGWLRSFLLSVWMCEKVWNIFNTQAYAN